MGTVAIKIDGHDVEAEEGTTVLAAALDAGIYIPHVCDHPNLTPTGQCGLCVVEVEGVEGCPVSCTTQAARGMVVRTKSVQLDELRRSAMLTMLTGHPPDCGTCDKYLNCEFQSLKQYFAIDQAEIPKHTRLFSVDADNPLFVQEPTKCIACGRCLSACADLRGVGILVYKNSGDDVYVSTTTDQSLAESGCRFCGACAEVCPTGAIRDKEEFVGDKSRKEALVPCRYACPAEIDVPRYVRFIREKNYSAAAAVIREKVPFPSVLGYVCDHPCEEVCRRGTVNEPVAIRNLKRYAAERDEDRLWERNLRQKASTGKRVAIVGSGPAGLTAAYYLANQGHGVHVFEAMPLAGGMMRYGIPEYRLPRDVLDREIADITKRGVEIETDVRIESIDRMFDQGYDAVLLTIGNQEGRRLRIEGADNRNALVGLDFLREVNLGNKVEVGKQVVVLGGGNVAFDCARVARRLGASVHIACLEPRNEMLAAPDEIAQAEEEGIAIHNSKTFTKIVERQGMILGVECLDVKSFRFNEDGKLHVETSENSEHLLEADTVIFAIGQRAVIPQGFGLDGASGIPTEADSCRVSAVREGVFAAGDAVAGPVSVIRAIASGRKSAIAIDKFLGGRGRIEEKLAPAEEATPQFVGPCVEFASMSRREESCIAAEQRVQGFDKVVQDMEEAAAEYESARCLQCDLRLNIQRVKFWGEY